MKKAIVVSGRHEPTSERYDEVVKSFKEAGYDTELHVPDWSKNSLKELVGEFLLKYKDEPIDTVLGFSLGGEIALIASTVIDLNKLILCSASGFFQDYSKLLPVGDHTFAKKHLKDFEDFPAKEVVKESKAKIGQIICGELELKEWPEFKKWMDDLNQWTNWPITIVPGTKHEIESQAYQRIIKRII